MNTRTFIAISAITIFASQLVAQTQRPSHGITLINQAGRIVPVDPTPNVTSQIFDVTVGPGGATMFSPNDVTISVGDTVRWTWASDRHSVTSGNPCTTDSQFCSPNDMNCTAGTLSNTGTIYQHTFNQAGTFSYFCALHCAFGMTGLVHVVGPACTPPPSGMVGWFPGDGNAREIANGNNGTLHGGAIFAAGEVGQAFSFNGIDAYVQTPDTGLPSGSAARTIDFWTKPNVSNARTPVIYGGFAASSSFYIILIGNNACIGMWTGGDVCGSTNVADGNWHHLALTYDGASTATLYVDGAFETSETRTYNTVLSGRLYIGSTVEGSGEYYNGLVDEVEIFNRGLSASEIQGIVNAGSAGKCKPPQPVSGVSRRVHGGAGTFDIDLNPNGSPGVECRSGPNYQVIFQFANPVTVSGATLIGVGTVSNFSVSGNTVTVNLTGVTNVQILVVKLLNVNDGTTSGDVPVAMAVLVGDTNGNRSVNAADVAQTKGRLGQTVDATNFRSDVNANGTLNAADAAIVKQNSGTSLPP
jgi:plastocyanin